MQERTSRNALITGGSRGLGLALAVELVRRGWSVIVDARGEVALGAAYRRLTRVSEASGRGGRITAVAGDVLDPEHRKALAEAALGEGGLDAVVLNAGTLGPSPRPRLLEYPPAALAEVFAVNVTAPLAVLQAVRTGLRPGARVVTVTSDAGREPYPGWGGYGASKAAMDHLTAILAVENPEWRVYCVDPGDMRTRMHREAYPDEDISDRPLPEASVPGLVALLEGDHPGGRYEARKVPPGAAAPVPAEAQP